MSMDISGVLGSAGQNALSRDQSTPREVASVDGRSESPQQPVRPLEVPEHQIDGLIKELETVTSALNRRLKFSINRELQQVVVKVVDRATDKVIKELPPEGIQRLYAKMQEALGLLIDEEI